jgi:hypothetical protein
LLRLLASVASAVVVAIALTACGGGGHKATSTTQSSTTTTTATTPAKAKPKPAPLSATVQVAKSAAPASATATAKNGDIVEFHTRVPAVKGKRHVTVTVKLSQAPASKWTMTASVGGQKAHATVTSANGKALVLSELHYTCTLPPLPSFCPARAVSSTTKNVSMQFTTTPATPVTLVATVGPIPGAPPPSTPGTLVVPAYTPTALVLAHSPNGASSGAKPSPTTSARPGDIVLMRARLKGGKGADNGAAQPVTLSFDQGPAKTITVSASVPGSTISHATITSATGSPIALVTPRYTCYLPPTLTFCPASKVTAASHKYSVVFPGTPKTQVTVEAVVQAA